MEKSKLVIDIEDDINEIIKNQNDENKVNIFIENFDKKYQILNKEEKIYIHFFFIDNSLAEGSLLYSEMYKLKETHSYMKFLVENFDELDKLTDTYVYLHNSQK